MIPREKALEDQKMDWFTNGYVGSSMLSNTEFDDQKIKNTKAAAMVVIDQIESALTDYGATSGELQNMDSEWRFWQSVKEQLNNL